MAYLIVFTFPFGIFLFDNYDLLWEELGTEYEKNRGEKGRRIVKVS